MLLALTQFAVSTIHKYRHLTQTLCCVPVFPTETESLPGKFVFMSLEVVITTSGAFKLLWKEQDGDLPPLQKFCKISKLNSTSTKS